MRKSISSTVQVISFTELAIQSKSKIQLTVREERSKIQLNVFAKITISVTAR